MRGIEIIERLFGDAGCKLAAKAATQRRLVQNDEATCFLDGRRDRLQVERSERSKINDFDLDTLGSKGGSLFFGPYYAGAVRHDGEVAAFARDAAAAEFTADRCFVDIAAERAIEQLVLKEEHRVRIVDRGEQQLLRIGWSGRHNDFQSRHVGEPGFHRLRMKIGRAASRGGV